MKRGFSALLLLGLCLTLTACGMTAGGKAVIQNPHPGPTPPDTNTKVMPEAADNDHYLFAMHELMRVFQASSVLLTSQDQGDFDFGCVHYKKADKPQKDGSVIFRTATYTDCNWQQSFGGQAFVWKIGAGTQIGEIFSLSLKELVAKAKLDISASPLAAPFSESTKPAGSNSGLGNTYLREVRITRPSEAQPSRYPFKATTMIGQEEKKTKRDFWRTKLKGDWLIDAGKPKAEIRELMFRFDQAKTTTQGKPERQILAFHSQGLISFDDSKCKRPLGTFVWETSDSEEHLVAVGQFEAKSDGLHLTNPAGFIPWPKSCLEFPPTTAE